MTSGVLVMKPALITIWILCTLGWVIISLFEFASPGVSQEFARLNESAGTVIASWGFVLLWLFGPPLAVYWLGLVIGRAFKRGDKAH